MTTDTLREALKRLADAANTVGVCYFDDKYLPLAVKKMLAEVEAVRAALAAAAPAAQPEPVLTERELRRALNYLGRDADCGIADFKMAAELFSVAQRLRAEDAAATPQEEPADPLDMKLPCDITVGPITHKKGVALRSLVSRLELLSKMVQEYADAGFAAPVQAPSVPPGWADVAAELRESAEAALPLETRCVHKSLLIQAAGLIEALAARPTQPTDTEGTGHAER